MIKLGALVVLITAAAAAAAALTADALDATGMMEADKLASEKLMAKLRDPKSAEFLDYEQIRDTLLKVMELDQDNVEARQLFEAHIVRDSQCSINHQQWLIRMLLQNKNTPLANYIRNIRDKYKYVCAKSYKKRFIPVMLDLDVDVEHAIDDFTKHLPEPSSFRDQLYKQSSDNFSLESLVKAIKDYLNVKVNEKQGSDDHQAGASSLLRASLEAHKRIEAAVERLMNACDQLNSSFQDFVWLLKIIDRPRDIGIEIERLLWDTKVCKMLQFEQIDKYLGEQYATIDEDERELVSKFVNLLRVPDEIWHNKMYQLTRPSIKSAVEMLVDEEHVHSNTFNGTKADEISRDKLEIGNDVLEKLEVACKSHLDKLKHFLWLIDIDLLTGFNTKEAIETLKRVRVCALVPFFHN